ncbi:MAG: poly-beta-1,6-N-acetyl-D-glucosamine biosynthesis protein PgaD [Terracidiphilus sp.]|jgi:poly-beta-1,6-N-acetyl-D-glucosamine biosynthesis protein PgaD
MRAERPIISHPEKVSPVQHATSLAITFLAWSLWAYIWLPTLSVISSVFGMPINQILVVRRPDETSLLLIFLVMLACNFAVSIWSSYNYIRYAKGSRRQRSTSTSHEEVGRAFGVSDPSTLSLLLQERSLKLYFDDAGVLVNVDPSDVMDSQLAIGRK